MVGLIRLRCELYALWGKSSDFGFEPFQKTAVSAYLACRWLRVPNSLRVTFDTVHDKGGEEFSH
jgi:hypothetical protein